MGIGKERNNWTRLSVIAVCPFLAVYKVWNVASPCRSTSPFYIGIHSSFGMRDLQSALLCHTPTLSSGMKPTSAVGGTPWRHSAGCDLSRLDRRTDIPAPHVSQLHVGHVSG
nr:hypothetical protein CFP56_41504 [Quercus suber]